MSEVAEAPEVGEVFTGPDSEDEIPKTKVAWGGRIKARTDIDWEKAKELKLSGMSFIQIAKRQNVPVSTLATGFARRGWVKGGLEGQKRDKMSHLPVNFKAAESEKRKQDYLDKVGYLIVEDGVNTLLRERPRTSFAVRDVFKTMNEIHTVAKDVFGIGKDESGPRTIINVGLLSDIPKRKLAVFVQSGDGVPDIIEVPTEVVTES